MDIQFISQFLARILQVIFWFIAKLDFTC
uniref:Uncharacterized protein n=1 Tax=Rhizophora mucronata TaxID=61149 RepID=A0A2P2QP43_RHIMU